MFWQQGNRRVRPVAPPAPVAEAAVSGAPGAVPDAAVSGAVPLDEEAPGWLPLGLRLLGAAALSAALLIAVLGGRYFFLNSPHFAVRNVRISPTQHVRTAALLLRAAVPLGSNLFQVDIAAVQQRLLTEPWLASVRVRRELPATLAIDVSEHQAVALLSLDSLYLMDETGTVFKRSTSLEYGELPVFTGVGRATYLMEPALARTLVRSGLQALTRYRQQPGRPTVGEVHIDRFAGVTLYTHEGTALRVGQGSDAELDQRLRRFDAVWAQLQRSGQRAAVMYLDNRAHPDHVTVRRVMAAPSGAAL